MTNEIIKDTMEIPIENIEFKLCIKGKGGQNFILEMKDGVFTSYNEITVVKDIPFKKKGRKR